MITAAATRAPHARILDERKDIPAFLRPSFLRGNILHQQHEDLLTAGLGREGLRHLILAPPFEDPFQPTPDEIRRNAILSSHLGLIDRRKEAGYGSLYGPGIVMNAEGESQISSDGRIPGAEYLAYAADSDSADAVITLMVQVPDTFDQDNPCIVAATPSGSRGIYGGVAAAGEWALQNGCAVAYTDKGAGIGIHDIEANVAYLINGQSADADALGNAAHFRISPEARANALGTGLRHRLAFKHAHAHTHPESNWGRHVLLAIQFAFFVLNVKYDRFSMGKPFTRGDVTVIASGISNGGGASLRAVEQDAMGWIDGFVVGEPAIQPRDDPRIQIKDRGNEVGKRGLPILDYMSFLAVYQPAVADAASTTSAGEEWRKRLAERGLLSGETDDERRKSAQEKIRSYGILKDQEILQKNHNTLLVPLSVSVTYANAYGRFAVDEFVCGYSFARTDNEGNPIPLTDPHSPLYPHLFSNGNGVPPYIFYPLLPPKAAAAAAPSGEATPTSTAEAAAPREIRISIVYDGKAADRMDVPAAVSAVLRLRRVVTGNDDETGEPLATEDRRQHERIAKGIQQVRASGYLHGTPGIIVHGRSDGVIAVNHTSRAYVALNQLVEGGRSKLHYVEVTNTQHFDAFNASVFFQS